MRICVIGSADGVHVLTRTRAFVKRGHDVVLISEQSAAANGIALLAPSPSAMPVFRTISTLYKLWSYIRREKADIYHVHYAASYGAWLAAAVGVHPLTVSVMGGDVLPDEQTSQSPVAWWLTRQTLRRADLVTSKSTYLTERLLRMRVAPDRILQALWGVDLDIFRRRDGSSARAALGIGPDNMVILSPRILRPFYNIDIIIDAFSRVVRNHPSAILVIMGYQADADYRNQLEVQTARLDISDRIRFIESVANEAMPEYYSMADIVVSLAPSDAIPTCVLEAMACETPALVTKLHRYDELFCHDDTVWMAELDAEKVGDELLKLINSQETRRKLSLRGARLVQDRADLARHVERIEQAFFMLASAAPLARRSRPPFFGFVMMCAIIVVALGFAVRKWFLFWRRNNGPAGASTGSI